MVKTSLNVALRKTDVTNWLFLRVILTSKKEKESFSSNPVLIFVAYESFLIFDQVMYRKIDGVAMGSPLGPILANAFLCHFEKKWLSE